jgi:hypothetical protein
VHKGWEEDKELSFEMFAFLNCQAIKGNQDTGFSLGIESHELKKKWKLILEQGWDLGTFTQLFTIFPPVNPTS